MDSTFVTSPGGSAPGPGPGAAATHAPRTGSGRLRAPTIAAVAALGLAAAALVAWSVADPRFRAADGALAPAFCLPLAGGAALGVLAWATAARALRAGVWAALAIVGQAAALQLVEAGPAVRYQHYIPISRMPVTAPPWALWLLSLQLAAVVTATVPRFGGALRWLRSQLGWGRLALAAVLCAAASAALSRRPVDLVAEIGLASLIQLLALANAALAAAALPDGALARIRRWRGLDLVRPDEAPRPGGPDRFILGVALWVTVTAAVLGVVAYQRFPHIPDEVSYLLQARYFARGLLALPLPPVPAAFNIDLMTFDPARWYSPFPPGWPAALALGVRLGVPWLVNPLLGGVSIVLAYVFLRELYPVRTARLATLLLALSPWQIFLAMSLMSHTLALTLALLAGIGAARARRGGPHAWAWVAGFATGVVSTMRPLEGVALAALLGLWLLGARGRRFRFAPVLGCALGAIVAGAPALWYNAQLTGNPLTFPVMAYFDRYYGPGVNALGFGAARGLDWQGLHPGTGHTPLNALVNAALNTAAINVELFGWAAGSLFLLVAFALSKRLRRSDWLMLATIAVVTGVHAFYWFGGGPDFGARYWYLVIVPCVALTARGIEWLDRASARRGLATALVLVLAAAAFVDFVPWRATDKYRHYRGMSPDLQALARERHFGRSLVLVRGRRHPDYAAAAVLNPLDLRAPRTIYAWDRSAAVRAQLARAYADRPVWIVDGPTRTGAGYQVVAGPLDPAALLQAATRVPYPSGVPGRPAHITMAARPPSAFQTTMHGTTP